MDWVYDDGGRSAAGYRGSTGDCVVRAIAIACQIPYQDVYDEIKLRNKRFQERARAYHTKFTQTGRRRSSSPREGSFRKAYEPYLLDNGWHWKPTMGIGTGTRVHLRTDELPSGRLIVSVSRHLVAVIDGVIHDTQDPSRNGLRAVYGYYHKEETA